MNMQRQTKTPTPAEVQEIIRQARRMRSAYLAKSIKAGLSILRGSFGRRNPVGGAFA